MRRLICLFLSILLIMGMLMPASGLEIWFVAVDDTIPTTLTGNSVPFYSGGELYVPYSVFHSDRLSVYAIHDSSSGVLAIYNIDHRLTFDLTSGLVTDLQENEISMTSVSRNGTVFVPAYSVAAYFGLGCVKLEGSGGYPILRLTSGNEIYDDEKLVTQASTLVEYWVEQYSSQETVVTPVATPGASSSPSVSQPKEVEVTSTPEPEKEPVTGADCALFLPGSLFPELKDCLDGIPVVFTYSYDNLKGNDETVRDIICSGYDIALILDLSSGTEAVRLLDECNDQLFRMAKYKSMMVLPANRSIGSDARNLLSEAGCRIWDYVITADKSFKITDYTGEIAVTYSYLSAKGLQQFSRVMNSIGSEFLTVRYTTEPFEAPTHK